MLSLITSTLGRKEPVERLLSSLNIQDRTDAELILVDQNAPPLEDALVSTLQRLSCTHIRNTGEVGLSKGRNRGLSCPNGDIIGFPDDDAWYYPGTIHLVCDYFEAHPEVDGVLGRLIAEDAGIREKIRLHVKKSRPVTSPAEAFEGHNANVMFFRSAVLRNVGGFDEELGVGSHTPWPSSEDTDLLIRAILSGHLVHFVPEIRIGHESVAITPDVSRLRARPYGLAMGHVGRRYGLGVRWISFKVARPLLGAAVATATGRLRLAHFRVTTAAARFAGWRARCNVNLDSLKGFISP